MVSFENILSKITIQDVVLVILVILVIYLMFKSNSSNSNNENFDTATAPVYGPGCSISTAATTEAFTNMGGIVDAIYTSSSAATLAIPEQLIIPASNVIINNLTLSGNLTASGNVIFTGKDSNIMDILPQFMIMAWGAADDIPLGWAPCDGGTYSFDSTQVQTPDLRGKFILSTDNAKNVFFSAGEENVTITTETMPSHTHRNSMDMWGGSEIAEEGSGEVYEYTTNWIEPNNVGYTGGDQPHNNMPPYITLLYIMKL